jgi:hypothetical protein
MEPLILFTLVKVIIQFINLLIYTSCEFTCYAEANSVVQPVELKKHQ